MPHRSSSSRSSLPRLREMSLLLAFGTRRSERRSANIDDAALVEECVETWEGGAATRGQEGKVSSPLRGHHLLVAPYAFCPFACVLLSWTLAFLRHHDNCYLAQDKTSWLKPFPQPSGGRGRPGRALRVPERRLRPPKRSRTLSRSRSRRRRPYGWRARVRGGTRPLWIANTDPKACRYWRWPRRLCRGHAPCRPPLH